ncbi:MAG: DEAD/DEAH box helicase [Anaerolineales bacterium]|nr:DEAD/DEAH box helicase [Anaerolineales bacterium]
MQTLHRLRLDNQFMRNVAAWERLPARPARYAAWPPALDPRLRAALAKQNIPQLYTHQSLAVQAARRGENVVMVTSTASGKTLGYNLPVLHTLLADANARALYLFPTKALAQDQADELGQLISALPNAPAHLLTHIYDGDTPTSQRASIRKAAGVLISNPDMLHAGILPHHPKWEGLFTHLKYVVIDELHTYRGLFGSNLANVLRRLKRICAFYGSQPQFICASATIANPRELAEKLLEAPVTLIDADGSPRAEKHFIVYNPPVIDATQGLRRSNLLEAQRIAGEFLKDDVQTALFARSRNATEILLGYVRDDVRAHAIQNGTNPATAQESVRGYRGGYLPLERREIERGLREGTVRGVVATNALELGVDIGQLGAVVMAGYAGTIASTWQQAGRAGRRSETSAVVLVASAAPLDQFIATHPRFLFERSPEHALINPDNLGLLANHLRCAVFELPFAPDENFGALGNVADLLEALTEEGEVHRAGKDFRWVGTAYPAEAVSLRSATQDRVVIQDVSEGRPRVIGEVDRATAPVRVHSGAVYLHEGRQYLITQLDWENALAEAQPTEVDYFTEASEAVEIEVVAVTDALEGNDAKPSNAWGHLLITAQAASYRQVRRYTHETLGYGEINLPAREFQTTGYWLWFPEALVKELQLQGIALGPNNYGPNWEQQRNAARARDGYVCRQCGKPEMPPSPSGRGAGGEGGGGRQHDVHHIQPFRTFGYIPGVNENYKPANALENLITLCASCHQRTEAVRGTQTALGGLANALSNVASLFLMCDPRDLGWQTEPRSRETKAPTITFYDRVPEGLGLAERLYELRAELLQGAYDLVRTCPCTDGCPACVGPVALEETNVKALTLQLAEKLIR